MENKKEEINTSDLLQAFKDLKVQYFLFENHMTGEKKVYAGLRGLVLHRHTIKLHGPESASVTRLDPDIGALLYEKQEETT